MAAKNNPLITIINIKPDSGANVNIFDFLDFIPIVLYKDKPIFIDS